MGSAPNPRSSYSLKPSGGGGEIYIDEVDDYAPLTNKRVVAIDPNMSDPQ